MLGLLLLAVFGAPTQVSDPVQVAARLSATEIQVGESTILEILVETRGPQVESLELPELPDGLEVSGTREHSQLQFSLPGGRTRTLRREVVLTATAPGDFVIRSATARVDGARFATRPLSLRVDGVATTPRPSAAPVDTPAATDADDDIRLRAWLTPDTVYVGQQVTLYAETMWASELRTRLRRIPQFIPPNITGFWVEELPEDRSSPTSVGGRRYERSSYSRALFPISPGTFNLPPARLRYDLRRGLSYTPDPQELSSDSLRLVVLPLPAENKPDSFTGAVGRYQVEAFTEQTQVPAGEAVNLVVVISGRGNIKALPPPVIPAAAGLRVFQPSEVTEVTPDRGGVEGTKRFSWVLVPQNSGTLEIPPIEYGYFDPEDGTYRVARSAPMAVNVGPAIRTDEADTAETARVPTIQFFRDEPGPAARLGWVRSNAFAAAQFLPLVAVLLVLWYRRPVEPRPPSVRSLRKRRRRELEALRARAVAEPDLCSRLTAAVRTAIVERTGVSRSRLSANGAAGTLERVGVTPATAAAVAHLFARADELRYRPEPPGLDEQLALTQEAERLLDDIDRETSSPPPIPRAAARAAAIGLVIVMAVALPARESAANPALAVPGTNVMRAMEPIQAAEPHDEDRLAGEPEPAATFRAGTEAAVAGQHQAAVTAFLDYVSSVPADANGWYNLGNAAYHAGDRGTAVWAWLRGARIAPRDRDARRNLALAGASRELVRRNTPWIPLSTDETLLLASAIWFLAALALTFFAFQRRRGAGPVGLAGLLAASLLLVSWAAPLVGSPRGIVREGQAQLLTGPAERAEPRLTIQPGTEVRITDERGEWLRVRARGGTEGWLEARRIGRL